MIGERAAPFGQPYDGAKGQAIDRARPVLRDINDRAWFPFEGGGDTSLPWRGGERRQGGVAGGAARARPFFLVGMAGPNVRFAGDVEPRWAPAGLVKQLGRADT